MTTSAVISSIGRLLGYCPGFREQSLGQQATRSLKKGNRRNNIAFGPTFLCLSVAAHWLGASRRGRLSHYSGRIAILRAGRAGTARFGGVDLARRRARRLALRRVTGGDASLGAVGDRVRRLAPAPAPRRPGHPWIAPSGAWSPREGRRACEILRLAR